MGAAAEPIAPERPVMSLDEAFARRRSVRTYAERAIPDGLLREIVDLARHAPSSMDGQPCHFVVVRDRSALSALANVKNLHCPPEKRAYPADFLADAAAVIAICAETPRSFGRARENGILAAAFLLLAATSRGLSGVYLSAYAGEDPGLRADVARLLLLPDDVEAVSLIALGFPAEPPAVRTLRPLEEILHDGTFDRALPLGDRSSP
ncbi:MAG TPA: nitroreductase family protein [Candidatus Binatia bacterium]|nr:nitroreductase family protein [Candidatus Binatia bacterium]